ncbi:hypothetical protein FQN49_001255 [Arthroderma sp. PD_2]|nr:hypothetical protein FQN49_001255 [Arthroderma sp. PD_2]
MQDRSRRLRTLRVFNSIHTPVPYPFKPPVGESVGVAGIDSSSGIFIGYLELSKEGHPIKKCGLICHHLVRPCLFGISPASHLAPITEDVGKYIKVQYPSSRDHLAELVLLDQKITHVKNLQRQHGSSKSIVERLKRYQVEKDWTISANRDIGTILASSGIAISNDENYRLDWALIDLYPGRAGTNTVKPPLFGHRETIGPQHPPVYLAREALYSELGYINPVRSCVYDRDASQGAPQETRTKEWAVVGGTTKDIIKGDPGILVRELETNKAIGVVWGGNNIMGTTYFTPLDVIAKSIREKTGYSARFLDSEEDA